MSNVIDLGYKPRYFQEKIHRLLKRFNVILCHRRFGKTHLSINEMKDKGLRCDKPNPQFAYIAPTYGQAKRVAWDILKHSLLNIPGTVTNEKDLRIDVPRPNKGDYVRFILLGAENPKTIRGIYLDGVVLDEYGDCSPILWGEIVRPALSDRIGWAIFIGTPKGKNHFYDIFMEASRDPDWYAGVYRASETNIIHPAELEAAKKTMSPEQYDQEYECSFSAALIGAYYGKYIQDAIANKRVIDVPYDAKYPVDTYWDLGVNDSTAVWFIQSDRYSHRVIDYLENSGEGLEWYADELSRRKYRYGRVYFPHDGNQRSMDTGKTRARTFEEMSRLRVTVLPKTRIEDGIEQVRLILPKVYFDAEKTKRGIDCLMHYQKKWDPKNQIFSTKPLHDWSSNGADAFRTFAMAVRESKVDVSSLPRQASIDYNF